MLCVRIKGSRFVIVQCNAGMIPIKYVDDISVTIGSFYRVNVLFTSDIKGALRFDDVNDALNALKLIRDEMDSDFTDILTIGRVFGNDEVLCLYR